MKLPILFTVFLSTLIALAEAISSAEVSKLRAKQKKPVISLKNTNFEKLLTGPRDFSVVVFLTASSPQIGCALCSVVDPDIASVAASWVLAHPQDDKLFFTRADFGDASRKVFEKFKLNNVPKLYLVKPTNDSSAPWDAGFEELAFIDGDNAQHLAEFVREHTGHAIHVVKPVRYDNLVFSILLVAGAAALAVRFADPFLRIVTSKQLWGAVVMLSILLFISGYMFNSIRGTPYIGGTQNGHPQYFMEGQQNQYAIETNILSTLYGLLAVFMIMLVKKVPELEHPRAIAIAAFVFSFFIFFGYSVLFDIFAKKSWGYPYRLLKLFNF